MRLDSRTGRGGLSTSVPEPTLCEPRLVVVRLVQTNDQSNVAFLEVTHVVLRGKGHVHLVVRCSLVAGGRKREPL